MGRYKARKEYWVDPDTGRSRYEFDALYTDYPDPWGCEQASESLANKVFVELIFANNKKYASFIDIGCGSGALSHLINCRNGVSGGGGSCCRCIKNSNSYRAGEVAWD